jgi:predicted metal-dependent phosphoesterase TrpH
VYRTAKARGMDLVTLTDHDSLDGCLEFLDRHPDSPDFIVGEEISCWFPDTDLEIHFGAWGMTEETHRELQPLRRNAFEVAAYLRGARIVFALNHPFHFFRGQVGLDGYLALIDSVPAVETRNGVMLSTHNALADVLARTRTPHARVGGSDAHTLRRVGRTWTEAPGRTREDFLSSLGAGMCEPGGSHGDGWALAADIYGVIGQYWLSLVGLRRHELSFVRRGLGIGFSLVSAPFEFLPILVASRKKRNEARWVARCRAELACEDSTVKSGFAAVGPVAGSR